MTDERIMAEWNLRFGANINKSQVLPFARALLSASIADTAGAVERMETTSEHIARDIREGRFPKRSEPQTVGIADTAGTKPEPVRDVVEAWDAYTADRSNEQAAILFVLAMNKLREEIAAPPALSVADVKPLPLKDQQS